MAVEVFETTLQKTYEWLDDLMRLLKWSDQHRAYLAFRGTLHAIRDRLPTEISAKFSAQLPMLIRGCFFEGWKPALVPVKVHSEEFSEYVNDYFNSVSLTDDTDVEEIVRAVFQVITSHISLGEMECIKQALPVPFADLWPSAEFSEELIRKRTRIDSRRQRSHK